MPKIRRLSIECIEPLPPKSCTEPWDTALQNIQSKFLRLGKPSNQIELLTKILEGEWAIFLQWVYKKKWNRSHKIPRQKAYANSEPMGDVLLAILNCCIEVHAVYPNHYPNAAVWFDSICWELKHKDLEGLLNSSGGKKAYLSYLRKEIIDCYKCRENPHDKETEPHIHRLIQALVEINNSRMFPDLIKTYWGGITKALQVFATHNDRSSFAYIEVDGEDIYIREGKNRYLVSQESVAIVVA